MKKPFSKLLPYISSAALVLAVMLTGHVLQEKAQLEEALNELSTYEIKVHREKRNLALLAALEREMSKKGLTGEMKGVDIEASFIILDFRAFLGKLSKIYHEQGLFFLKSFKEKTEWSSADNTDTDRNIQEPLSIVQITGKKIIGNKP